MADTPNTLTSINANLKYVQQELKKLVPENAVLLKMLPKIESAQRLGRKWLQSVQLAPEQGVTYGDGTAFTLNDAVAGVYEEIEVDASPVVLSSVVSESAANRMANREVFLSGEGALRTLGMYEAMARRAEISMLYGQAGIGTTSSSANVDSTTTDVTFTAASWSDGIWAGALNAQTQFYNGASLISSSTDAIFTVSKVDAENRVVRFTGTATGIAALDTSIGSGARTCFFHGSKSNDMLGLDKQITGGTSYFGIDPVTYSLWQGCTYSAGSASLTMAKVLAAVAKPVAKGGLNTDVELHVSAPTYANLQSDEAALRAYDGSYSSKRAERGSEEICYHGPNGKIKVVLNNIVKHGEAFILPSKHIRRVGAKDIDWCAFDGKEEYVKFMETKAAYQLRMSFEFAVVLDAPARACKITGIVNS